jgi:hypothetical protein
VEQVVMRGLSKDPRQRYPDTLAFALDLDRALLQNDDAEATPGLFSRVKSIFRR